MADRPAREARAGQVGEAARGGQLGQDDVPGRGAGARALRMAGQRVLPGVGRADAPGDTILGTLALAIRFRHVRILVASASTAFTREADDDVADALADACRALRPGDPVERVRLPAGPHLAAAARLSDVGEYAERLVCVGLRAAPLRHPGRRVWALDDGRLGAEARRSACAGALGVFAASAEVAAALGGAPLLAVPGPGASWAGVLEALLA
jgi:hypothetical protein